ncbi:MAG: excinuclease ABC subunit B, partial [Methylobacteriaceae bacterium]|nr:excinuclease ABC subunit B [Methylobacteriaceae bacterium]
MNAFPQKTRRARRESSASRPELKPLEPHLAELLNPAINRKRAEVEEKHSGHMELGEIPQTMLRGVTPFALPLREPDKPRRKKTKPLLGEGTGAGGGVSATVDALAHLLEEGDPHFRGGVPWVPHRPPRPDKTEGGIPFKLVSDFTPAGDQPQAIGELVNGIRDGERDQVLLG